MRRRIVGLFALFALAGCASVLGLDPLELGPNQDAGVIADAGTPIDAELIVDATTDTGLDAGSDATDASDQ